MTNILVEAHPEKFWAIITKIQNPNGPDTICQYLSAKKAIELLRSYNQNEVNIVFTGPEDYVKYYEKILKEKRKND